MVKSLLALTLTMLCLGAQAQAIETPDDFNLVCDPYLISVDTSWTQRIKNLDADSGVGEISYAIVEAMPGSTVNEEWSVDRKGRASNYSIRFQYGDALFLDRMSGELITGTYVNTRKSLALKLAVID